MIHFEVRNTAAVVVSRVAWWKIALCRRSDVPTNLLASASLQITRPSSITIIYTSHRSPLERSGDGANLKFQVMSVSFFFVYFTFTALVLQFRVEFRCVAGLCYSPFDRGNPHCMLGNQHYTNTLLMYLLIDYQGNYAVLIYYED